MCRCDLFTYHFPVTQKTYKSGKNTCLPIMTHEGLVHFACQMYFPFVSMQQKTDMPSPDMSV